MAGVHITSPENVSYDNAAKILVLSMLSGASKQGAVEGTVLISSTVFATVIELLGKTKQRSRKPKTPHQRTKQFVQDVLMQADFFSAWLNEHELTVEFDDACQIEGKAGTCVVLRNQVAL